MPEIKDIFKTIHKTGVASWYGKLFHGETTASGEIFNKEALTFAHKDLPFGTFVKFYYGGKSVISRCNDRGPYVKDRHFDLSERVANELGLIKKGVDDIEYQILIKPKRGGEIK